jgi:hypothetical protein
MNRRLQRRVTGKEQDYSTDTNKSRENNNLKSNPITASSRQSDYEYEFAQSLSPTMSSNQTTSSSELSSSEIVAMLQKINLQLEKMQQNEVRSSTKQEHTNESADNDTQQSSDNKSQQQTQQNADTTNTTSGMDDVQAAQGLQALFSQLLQGKGNSQQPAEQEKPQPASQNANEQSGGQQTNSVVAKTAAQVLAQAQYELSNELEASLQKLKQVISESEKIANKISNLLGEENSTNQS